MGKILEELQKSGLDRDVLEKNSNNHDRRKYLNKILSYELLSELFIEESLTANAICINILKPLGLQMSAGSLIERAQRLQIKTPTLKVSANNKLVREKYKQVCMTKYGTENALSKNSSAYEKRNRTIKEKYGVSNVFQLEAVKQKSISTMIEKYGVKHSVELDSYERNNGRRSKVHTKVENILTELSVPFQSEVKSKFRAHNELLGREYSPQVDILIESCKLVVEIYGNLWHANPSMYKDNDLIYKWNGSIKAKDIRAFDEARVKQIESFGYEVICFWESDINKTPEIIKEKLYAKCKNSINKEN